ncbi:MAG: bifunctional phosphopantothenoylcysteine decarboxylase/phosphopantothenate--cysteine ligase CoaBC, partial [Firmicutes bacterium]|nr:bifunctional phosphopantothenoylcysteine decarboxylase/phosphopantothenate--cysteine ligase CoaBC [Bacillota bacterium]
MRIIVGISGSIAAYKACDLVSRLVQAQHEVQVVMTAAATQFVTPLACAAMSGREVAVHAADQPLGPLSHVKLAQWADAVVIAPASKDFLAKIAWGLAEDMLALVLLGFAKRIILAPAMEPALFSHATTQEHLRLLAQRGMEIVGPASGRMASGQWGAGRLVDCETLVDVIQAPPASQSLDKITVLVTAGPTREFFDPVRYLSNPATGYMGLALARAAFRRGARVMLIGGPGILVPKWPDMSAVLVNTAAEMHQAVCRSMPDADVLIASAAVSDFRPADAAADKMHKSDVSLAWPMVYTPDILAEVGERYGGRKILVGFAAETHEVLQSALSKLQRKHLDMIVANPVGAQQGFGSGVYQAHRILA